MLLRNYARRHDFPCPAKCKAELLCALRRGHHNESALCPESSLFRRAFSLHKASSVVDQALLEPLTRDEFIVDLKRTLWNKVTSWLGR